MLSLIQSHRGGRRLMSAIPSYFGTISSKFSLATCLFFLGLSGLIAEGTPELAPNMAITIMGQTGSSNPITSHTSNDVAALNLGNTEYNYFAYRGKTQNEAKLNVYVADPTSENLYVGLSFGTDNRLYGRAIMKYRFYVLDPSGNVVYTSDVIDDTNAPITHSSSIHADLNMAWEQTMAGATQLGGTGYDAIEITSADLTSTGNTVAGDYSIEFEAVDDNGNAIPNFGEGMDPDDYLIINYWDINVAQGNTGKKGRVWSKNWGLFAVNDYGFPNRPFNGAFYVCAPDPSNEDLSYITKIDFNNAGYRPGGFNIAFNSFGTQMEDMANGLFFPETAKSVPNANVSSPEYDIYLNDPVERCLAAESASVLDLNGITNCETNAVNYCISFTTDKPGEVLLLLDFDQRDGKYTSGTTDLLIPFTVTDANLGADICIDWNGQDGLGNQVSGEVPLVLEFIQGRYNLPIYDAEFMVNGFMIEAVRPSGPAPQIFYDDTDIPEDPLTGSPKDGTAGCTAPCHNWDNYVDDNVPGYGNLHTINTWWFSNRLVDELIAEFPVVLECTLTGPDGICANGEEVITLSLSQSPDNGTTPDYEVEWNGPGVVSSDDASATINAAGDYTATVSWTTSTGEMCSSSCSASVDELPEATSKDSILVAGQDFTYEGQTFTSDTMAIFEYPGMASNGCDSIFTYCIAFRPDVELFCSISGPDGICEGGMETLTLTTSHQPASEPFPTINSVVWDGTGIISSTDTDAVVTGGDTYTVTINYTDQNGNEKVATCELFVDSYPNEFTKVDEVIPFGGEIEINGVIYDGTAVDTFAFTTVNGCDSTVVVCVTEEDPDIVLTCELNGPAGVCESETGLVTLTYTYTPVGAPEPIINDIIWTGNGIVSANADLTEATVTGGDTYMVQINYTNPVNGETKDAFCEITVDQYPEYFTKVDTVKIPNTPIEVFGITYDSPGEFVEEYQTVNGCDSTVVVCITEEECLVYYDLDDCKSSDYSRFKAQVSEEFDCGDVSGSTFYRINPIVNAHSCTEGAVGNAVCISSVDACTYNPGDEKSGIIDLVLNPAEGKAIKISGLDFYERAPEEYQWNVGHSGINNYPTKYGLRVLINGVEVYNESEMETTEDWTLESFRFLGIDAFEIEVPSLVRFEFLGYCTVGADSHVTAWDLDEIKIYASCINAPSNTIDIAGKVKDYFGSPLENVGVFLDSEGLGGNAKVSVTDADGSYAFDNLEMAQDYEIKPVLDRDHLKGVTTADIVLILRHVLGIETFDNAYQMIAADANNSGDITASDILELRKLILGVYEELPNNTSYRFAADDQEMDINNPWIMSETYDMANLEYSFVKGHFTAIKVGDVSSFKLDQGGKKSLSTIENAIQIDNQNIKAGETYSVSLDLSNATDLEIMQWALDISNFSDVTVVGLDGKNVNYFVDLEAQELRFIWTPQLTTSFDIQFTANRSGDLDELLQLNDDSFQSQGLYGQSLEEVNIGIEFSGKDADLTHLSITPNPFNDEISIQLDNNAPAVTIEILSMDGRRLYARNITTDGQATVVNINKSDINNYRGMCVIRISDGQSTHVETILSL